jgi:hypothetical protein
VAATIGPPFGSRGISAARLVAANLRSPEQARWQPLHTLLAEKRAAAESKLRALTMLLADCSLVPEDEQQQLRIWLAIVALAVELTAWMQMLAFADVPARRWEPKRLRLRIFSIAARVADHGRTRRLHLSTHAPWAAVLITGLDRLRLIPAPG